MFTNLFAILRALFMRKINVKVIYKLFQLNCKTYIDNLYYIQKGSILKQLVQLEFTRL